MRVFDCFTFFNELDLLRLRLTELYPVVDRFILVEADRTFTNVPKPLYFQEARNDFVSFLDKIIHVAVRDMPGGGDPWVRERFQRDAIIRGVPALDPLDILMISDLDEIPRPEAIAAMRMTKYKVYGLHMPLFNFKLNFLNLTCHEIYTIGFRPPITQSPHQLRMLRFPLNNPEFLAHNANMAAVLYHAGWQFSFLGDDEFVKNKIRSFSHQEHNTPAVIASINVEELVSCRKDLLDRPYHWEVVSFNEYFPRSAHAMPEIRRWLAPAEGARRLSRDPTDGYKLLP